MSDKLQIVLAGIARCVEVSDFRAQMVALWGGVVGQPIASRSV